MFKFLDKVTEFVGGAIGLLITFTILILCISIVIGLIIGLFHLVGLGFTIVIILLALIYLKDYDD